MEINQVAALLPLCQRVLKHALDPSDCEAIAFVLVKAIGTLLWLSLSQETAFRQRLVAETKRLTLSYLQSYVHQ